MTITLDGSSGITGGKAIVIDSLGIRNKNLIINPSGSVDQRGGSSTINTYSVDRWRSYGGPGGFTISQRTDAGEGDTYAIRFQRTASDSQTNAMGIAQGLETVDSKTLAGKTLTVSFRARKGANWSPTNFDAVVYHGTGTDDNPVGMTGQSSNVAVDDASLTTSFQTFSGSVTIPSNKTQVTLGFRWTPSGTAGANDYVDIREVKMEIGDTATDFESRSFGEELALCQRYFQSYNEPPARGTTSGGSTDRMAFMLPVVMRAAPAVTMSGTLNWYDGAAVGTITSLSATYTKPHSVEFDANFASGSSSAGRGMTIYNAGADGTLKMDAEL